MPLWLATPSRFATWGQRGARIGLAVLAALLLATMLALVSPAPPTVSHAPANHANARADVLLHETIVQGVRGGGDYYAVAAQALRMGDYPMRPFLTFRLPTLAVVEAMLPPRATLVLLYALVLGVVVAWFGRLRPAFARPVPRGIALALLAGGLITVMQRELIALHEIWAGLLIALSLALRREDRWVEAAAIGLIAMLLRETAALYVGIMAVFALVEGKRREALGWAATLALFAVVIAVHAYALSFVVRASDPALPAWAGMLGFGFFVKTMQLSTALYLVPVWLAAPLVGLALFGWAAWRSPLAPRALAVILGYAGLLALFGRTDTFYWGLMIAPTLLIGLAFAPDGLRDLTARAQGAGRRITVTRVAR